VAELVTHLLPRFGAGRALDGAAAVFRGVANNARIAAGLIATGSAKTHNVNAEAASLARADSGCDTGSARTAPKCVAPLGSRIFRWRAVG